MVISNAIEPELSDREFRLIAKLVADKFGIHLEDNKKSLVVSRLKKTISQRNLESFEAYYDIVQADKSGIELLDLIDKISTNHSFFFREIEHFNFLKQNLSGILHKRTDRGGGKLTIWSAGCAAGEEPYTIAMVLSELKGTVLNGIEIKILATDISLSVLAEADKGIYSEEKLKLVPKYFRVKYFDKIDGGRYKIKNSLRNMVLFKRLNLMQEKFPFKGKFDVIFCRNVMIYFKAATRDALVDRFTTVLNPGGYLFIGHSETLGRNHNKLKYKDPAIYQHG